MRIPIERLAGCAPSGPIVSAERMQSAADAAAVLQRAHVFADEHREAAVRCLAQAKSEAEAIRESARRAGMAAAREEIDAARAAAVDAAVTWFADESALERTIVESLDKRIREAIASALAAFVSQQDTVEMLSLRIARNIPAMAADGGLTLRAHPDHVEGIKTALVALAPLRAMPDSRLPPSQALLESPVASVRIDIDADLARIRQHFLQTPAPGFAYG
ncbi:hypothetical protein GCM10027419_41110 [Pandoraea terrae]